MGMSKMYEPLVVDKQPSSLLLSEQAPLAMLASVHDASSPKSILKEPTNFDDRLLRSATERKVRFAPQEIRLLRAEREQAPLTLPERLARGDREVQGAGSKQFN